MFKNFFHIFGQFCFLFEAFAKNACGADTERGEGLKHVQDAHFLLCCVFITSSTFVIRCLHKYLCYPVNYFQEADLVDTEVRHKQKS